MKYNGTHGLVARHGTHDLVASLEFITWVSRLSYGSKNRYKKQNLSNIMH